MFHDAWLILRFKSGSAEALGRIYEKYRHYLLTLATALLQDVNAAEDVVQDVFVRFARSGRRLGLGGSLKSYLRTSVINGIRNRMRDNRTHGHAELCDDCMDSKSASSESWVILNEDSMRIKNALAQIPFEQRQAVVLHLCGEMTFREIADLEEQSLKTIQSRYRYGLEKLRAILGNEAKP